MFVKTTACALVTDTIKIDTTAAKNWMNCFVAPTRQRLKNDILLFCSFAEGFTVLKSYGFSFLFALCKAIRLRRFQEKVSFSSLGRRQDEPIEQVAAVVRYGNLIYAVGQDGLARQIHPIGCSQIYILLQRVAGPGKV
jgi:hypothetical protein